MRSIRWEEDHTRAGVEGAWRPAAKTLAPPLKESSCLKGTCAGKNGVIFSYLSFKPSACAQMGYHTPLLLGDRIASVAYLPPDISRLQRVGGRLAGQKRLRRSEGGWTVGVYVDNGTRICRGETKLQGGGAVCVHEKSCHIGGSRMPSASSPL